MTLNILITGAAGYIGGSVVDDFRSRNSDFIQSENIKVVVRSGEQVQLLSHKGINAILLDLNDAEAVTKAVVSNYIDLVVHCASGLEANLALNLVKALGKRRESSGRDTYFIHTSGGSAFSEESGWPAGELKDTDSVFELEKKLADSNPLRQVDVCVTEEAIACGVTSFIVVPTLVYGKGGGEWNKLSVCLPRYIKGSISHKAVYKFSEDLSMPAVHLSDLMALYARLVEKITAKEELPNGKDGYYFAVAHSFKWWATLAQLATSLHSRGLVETTNVNIWPSDEVAAEALGLPVPFMHMIWNSRTNMSSDKKRLLGWEPVWNSEESFLESMDDEVQSVQELDRGTSTVFNALNA